MIEHRHTFLTLGAFGLVLGTVLAALGLAGLAFAAPSSDVFLAVCPPAILVPSGILAVTGFRLVRHHRRLKAVAGMMERKEALGVDAIQAELRVSQREAVRLALMAIAEGYVTAVFDPPTRTLRRKA